MWLLMPTAFATPPLTAEMHERFALLVETRDHVVHGRLGDARMTATLLAEVDPPSGLPSEWNRSLRSLRRESRRTAKSGQLVDAALGVGRIAQVCSDCHAASGGGPGLAQAVEVPNQEWVEGENMALHKWSFEWMWLGLVAADDAAWKRGAETLDDRPLAPRFEDAPPRSGQAKLEQLVYGIANLATTAEPAQRGEHLGQLLATCSECHFRSATP